MRLLDHLLVLWLLRRVPARLRLLHALRAGEVLVVECCRTYATNPGLMYAHLARLETRDQVTSWWREDGRRVYALVPNWTPRSYSDVLTPDVAARLDHLVALRAMAHQQAHPNS